MFINNFDPVAFEIFSLEIRWYSLSYIFGLVFGWYFAKNKLIKDSTQKEFFDDYFVDWKYGDSNHSATLKCLDENKKFLHLGPYYDNPNFETDNTTRTYYYNDKKFLTHLKGGFSENKLSYKKRKSHLTYTDDVEDYITLIND